MTRTPWAPPSADGRLHAVPSSGPPAQHARESADFVRQPPDSERPVHAVDLTPRLAAELAVAAETDGDGAHGLARRLAVSLTPEARLVLLNALSEADALHESDHPAGHKASSAAAYGPGCDLPPHQQPEPGRPADDPEPGRPAYDPEPDHPAGTSRAAAYRTSCELPTHQQPEPGRPAGDPEPGDPAGTSRAVAHRTGCELSASAPSGAPEVRVAPPPSGLRSLRILPTYREPGTGRPADCSESGDPELWPASRNDPPDGLIRLRFADAVALERAGAAFGAGSGPGFADAWSEPATLTLRIRGDAGVETLRAVLAVLDAAAITAESLTVHTHELDDVFAAFTSLP
ncbi:hypothetical protein [Streptomyces sp. GESEQ-35]|uniref:hypothetical protein n=1 Tax=Streptomyces sp. GESEQ-35 TaxID=2812657 RepID=UPI001B326F5D|nr:hypothetical protein [Streptomyces sp. GESEQ-35]